MTMYFLTFRNENDVLCDGRVLRVQRLLISRPVSETFSETEIHDFVRRHELVEWGDYKVAWGEHNDQMLGRGAVCSCFEVNGERLLKNPVASGPAKEFLRMLPGHEEPITFQLLVKTALNRNRTIIRFDHERLETRRYREAEAKGLPVHSFGP